MNATQVAFSALFALLALALAAMTWLARRERRARQRAGQREWAVGLLLQTVAWPLFAIDLPPAPHLPAALGCGLLVAGYAGMARALLRSVGARSPRWPVYLPGAVLAALLASNVFLVTLQITLFWCFALLTIAVFTWSFAQLLRLPQPWSLKAVVLIFGGAALVCAYRLAEQLLQPQWGPAYDGALTPAQGVALGYFLLAPVFATFAFLMLQQERQQAWLEDLAAQDPLTGVNNRRAFFAQAEAMGARETLGGRLVAWLMIDIDSFKAINDRHGHGVGDVILRQVSDALGDTLRGSDIAGRFGGDEFCALLFDVQPGEAAQRAERLRQRIVAQSVGGAGQVVMATVSIGVAHARWDRRIDLDVLMAAADRRLYAAKRAGRNRVVASDVDAVPVAPPAARPSAQPAR